MKRSAKKLYAFLPDVVMIILTVAMVPLVKEPLGVGTKAPKDGRSAF